MFDGRCISVSASANEAQAAQVLQAAQAAIDESEGKVDAAQRMTDAAAAAADKAKAPKVNPMKASAKAVKVKAKKVKKKIQKVAADKTIKLKKGLKKGTDKVTVVTTEGNASYKAVIQNEFVKIKVK